MGKSEEDDDTILAVQDDLLGRKNPGDAGIPPDVLQPDGPEPLLY